MVVLVLFLDGGVGLAGSPGEGGEFLLELVELDVGHVAELVLVNGGHAHAHLHALGQVELHGLEEQRRTRRLHLAHAHNAMIALERVLALLLAAQRLVRLDRVGARRHRVRLDHLHAHLAAQRLHVVHVAVETHVVVARQVDVEQRIDGKRHLARQIRRVVELERLVGHVIEGRRRLVFEHSALNGIVLCGEQVEQLVAVAAAAVERP